MKEYTRLLAGYVLRLKVQVFGVVFRSQNYDDATDAISRRPPEALEHEKGDTDVSKVTFFNCIVR